MGPTARRRLAATLAASVAVAALAVGGGPAAFSASGGPTGADGVAAVPFTSGSGADDSGAGVASDVRARVGEAQTVLAAARRAAAAPPRAQIAVVTGAAAVDVRDRPGGRVALRLGATTEFGTARRLGVVQRRGRWLGVTVPDLPNGTLGWVDARDGAVQVERTSWSLHADLSDRTLVLRRDGDVVRRATVAIGTPSSPTPTGRFAVTDKLDGTAYGPYYGCCVLALSATQPNLPAGWTGGNRMAIHGTDAPSTIGAAASAGCLRAADDDLRALMDRVPVGAPVVIRD